VAADAASAEVLGWRRAARCSAWSGCRFTYGDKPVELRRGLYRTEQHFYRNELN
jgi:GntR family transcriptional regulator